MVVRSFAGGLQCRLASLAAEKLCQDPSVRIVLGTYQFDDVGGSETYAITIAEQFLKLGHDITIYVKAPGKMAQVARDRAIRIATDLELPTPDVVLSQDGVVAYEMSARWPEVPHAFICHSPLFELQTPPAVPGVVGAVVVMSERFEDRLRALATKHRIVRFRQPIDVDRLAPRGAARKQPKKALLLGNYLQGEAKRFLVDAWSGAGVEFMQVGSPAGTNSADIVQAIAEADIVVGKARAILDAMSCGRPAYVYDVFGMDGWVTPQVYETMEADAFAGLALSRPFEPSQLVTDLGAYDPLMGMANRKLVMMHHHARIHAQQMIDLCSDLAKPTASRTTPKLELSRLVASNWRSESKLLSARIAFGPVAERAKRAEDEVSRLRGENEQYRRTIEQLTRELNIPTAGEERNEFRRRMAAKVDRDLKADQGQLSENTWDEPGVKIHMSQINRRVVIAKIKRLIRKHYRRPTE
ncbi:hypothetical protein [Mesorhizobium sp. B2-1-3A]|uniref:hypothetical protein n=1 Tax=Mesorhizobium sp. B2-1-3A TaxID=2589971 RepID=UPI0011295493|nr:hypothetical protein [Mesorhizobium sp. B2-1-3A]TPM90930.1 hypothetical protein FJ977_33110 [Mesorhizobium sp. B2-1-3A]